MKTEQIIILIILLIMIYLLYNKNKEHLLVGAEPVMNIAKIYSDASGTASFNNLNIGGKIFSPNNNLDISANITTNSINSYMMKMNDVDLRYYLPGVTLYSISTADTQSKKFNTMTKVDLQLGKYLVGGTIGDSWDTAWNDKANIAIIYPGFGASFFAGEYDNSNVFNVDNYGLKPLRIKFGATPSVYAGTAAEQDIYNVDSNTYEIIGKDVGEDTVTSVEVILARDENKWKKHKIN